MNEQCPLTLAIQASLLVLTSEANRAQPLNVVPVTFAFEEFDHVDESTLESPSFYSHRQGYKMLLQLQLLDPQEAAAVVSGPTVPGVEYLTLSCMFRPGEFDEYLNWPFHGRITIQVLKLPKMEEMDLNVISFADDFVQKGSSRGVMAVIGRIRTSRYNLRHRKHSSCDEIKFRDTVIRVNQVELC